MASNFKSAFESVPGRDALLQYEEKNYPNRTYVERNGLIFKSLTATSENFVLSQWELIGDLREVRVPDIAARNSLTGTTGTSYGVHTPILDNTNVLVLDASADPQVGAAQFARYNYNLGSASWLLLQVGTGSTSASTSIEYSNVLNRPFIVSGVTVNAGAGLAGGGSVFGSIPAAGGIINLAHADTSSQGNLTPTGRTYIQQLRFDTYGHVTGATQSTWTHPATSSQANVLNTGRTYIQSISIDANGHITNLSSSPWIHPDTSTQADSVNAGNTFIQTIYLDGDGHVIGLGTGVAAGGGGGSALTYNGNSGGALTMNSGATLNITGGTNILTVRSGNAANPGLRINVNPAGLAGQVQYNGGSGAGLSASSNFVYSGGTNTLYIPNLNLSALPASGATITDDFLMRFSNGTVRRMSYNTLFNTIAPGGSSNNIMYKGVGTFLSNDNQWYFTPSTKSLTLGTRVAAVAEGVNSISVGVLNTLSAPRSGVVGGNNIIGTPNGSVFVVGNTNTVSGATIINSLVGGTFNTVIGGGSNLVYGTQNYVTGSTSAIFGQVNANYSHFNLMAGYANSIHSTSSYSAAFGQGNTVRGTHSFVGGRNLNAGKRSTAGSPGVGSGAFTFQTTNGSLPAYPNGEGGAKGAHTAVLGGLNNYIDETNSGTTIIGGQSVSIGAGGSYNYHAVVSNLAIITTPTNDDTLTQILVRDPANGKVRYKDSGSLIRTAVVTISSAQMLNSFTTPIVILPAPGAGKFINVMSINGTLTYGTTPYATNISAFFRYNNLSAPINSASWNIAQTANRFVRFTVGTNGTGEDPTLIENKNITLSTQTGNPTAGDSTFKVYIAYQIITL